MGSRDIPPGVHLQVMFTPEGLPRRQLRILGDDVRGYLIAGISDMPGGDDIWFRTLEMAYVRAERVGVAREAWTDIMDVGQVEML